MPAYMTRRLPSFWRDFDELFRATATPSADVLAPAADVVETEKSFEIHLDLPGVNPDAIDVKLDGDVLTITAERKSEKKTEGTEWLRQERSYGRYSRSFTLPNTIDAQPEATFRHGVLTVTLPKKPEVQPRSLKVKVEA